MEWEEDPQGHNNDPDNQRTPFSQLPLSLPYAGSSWENVAADSMEDKFARRLDYLLPIDGETGVATHEAVCTYLNTMIEMVSRHGLPLAVLSIAVDDSPVLRFLGPEGAALVGRGVARCLRQETRTHDVVGHADPEISPDAFTFLIICPASAGTAGDQPGGAITRGDDGYHWRTGVALAEYQRGGCAHVPRCNRLETADCAEHGRPAAGAAGRRQSRVAAHGYPPPHH